MRLLFFSNVYPNPARPFKGAFNRALIDALAERHAVEVVCPVSWTEQFSATLRRVGGEFGTAPVVYPPFYYPPKLLRSAYHHFLEWSVGDRLRRAVDRLHPDVLLSYWAHPDGTVAVRAAHRAGIPAAVIVGGSDVLLLARRGRRRKAILDTLRAADLVLPVNRDLARVLREDGIPDERLHVWRRGIDRGRFHPGDRAEARRRLGLPHDQGILVAAGRLVPVKGLATLIRACRVLVDQRVPIGCYVLGDGPLAGQLDREIRSCGLSGIVELRGPQCQEMLADWYRAADLTVLPSLSEGIPNVLLESIACETPFVASRVGGIPEIADAAHDRLAPPGDPAALAAEIADCLRSPKPTTPRRFVPQSWGESARELIEILEHSLGAGGQPPSGKVTKEDSLALVETAST